MRIKTFRIRNYKCINDSGEIPVGDIISLTGKNETGKTAILEALHKFNSGPDNRFVRKEFPRSRSRECSEDTQCVEAVFSLMEEERKKLGTIAPGLEAIKEVTISKDYANRFHVHFADSGPLSDLSLEKAIIEGRSLLERSVSSFVSHSGSPPRLSEAEEEIRAFLTSCSRLGTVPPLEEMAAQIKEMVPLFLRKEQAAEFDNLIADIKTLGESLTQKLTLEKAQQAILEMAPTFAYFSDYDMIEGKININEFLEKKRTGSLSGAYKTMHNLFRQARLDVEELHRLEREEEWESRMILCHQSSTEITAQLNRIWSQRTHTVTFACDGPILTVYVSDDLDKAPIPLSERGKGFRWYFSFYINLAAEINNGLKNTVLLMDEPGLHLHPIAQEELLGVLERFSQHNQIIYTTHSPFMIWKDKKERTCVVTADREKGTTLSSNGGVQNVTSSDSESLQAA